MGGRPQGSAGSHLPALQSTLLGNVPCPPRRGSDLPWLCHPLRWRHEVCPSGLAASGMDPLPVVQGTGEGPISSHSPPRSVHPRGQAEPDDLLSPGQHLQLVAPSWQGCHLCPGTPGCVAASPSTSGHQGAGTHLPGGTGSLWYPTMRWAGSAALRVDGWQGSLEELCPAPSSFCKAKSLILASWGKVVPPPKW